MQLAPPPSFFQTDIQRAKKQLESALMMNMESRVVNFEDLGRFVNAILQHICHMINCNRQVLATGTRMSTEELCKRIGEYYM